MCQRELAAEVEKQVDTAISTGQDIRERKGSRKELQEWFEHAGERRQKCFTCRRELQRVEPGSDRQKPFRRF